MLRKLNLILVSFMLTALYGFSQNGLGTIRGTVQDANSKVPVAFARVEILQNGTRKGIVNTDLDG